MLTGGAARTQVMACCVGPQRESLEAQTPRKGPSLLLPLHPVPGPGALQDSEPGTLSAMASLRHLTALKLQLNDRGTSAALLDELQLLQGLTDLDLSG